MVKSVVLDFDGVIVDSNRLKREAFFSLFPHTEEMTSLISAVLSRSQRRSRFEILRDILRVSSPSEKPLEPSVTQYAEKYNERVQQGIAQLGLIADVRETLGTLARRYQLHLNSGTYEPALRESILRLGIGHFFGEIYGGPASKTDNLKKIMLATKTTGRETVVIGDGEEDYESSLSCGCFFIGVANGFKGWDGRSFPLVSSLSLSVDLIGSFPSGDTDGARAGQDHRRRIGR